MVSPGATGNPAAYSAGLGQRPIASCPADYDLVKVENDALVFGSRPADNDMCSSEKRPTSLSALSSKRK